MVTITERTAPEDIFTPRTGGISATGTQAHVEKEDMPTLSIVKFVSASVCDLVYFI